jgi:uncharacterized protein YidB (DUF937 family)
MTYNPGLDNLFLSKVETESNYFTVLMWIESHGGISQIIDTLVQHDLRNTVTSWLEDGKNFSIYPEQILSVINSDELDDLATSCNTDLLGAARQMTAVLPTLVDGLSANGKLHLPPERDFLTYGINILCGR